MLSFVTKYDTGGRIDTDAMTQDLLESEVFFNKGRYTAAGKKRLAAINAIAADQRKGLTYAFDGQGGYNIRDKSGNDVYDAQGIGILKEESDRNRTGLGRYKHRSNISEVLGMAKLYQLPENLEGITTTPQTSLLPRPEAIQEGEPEKRSEYKRVQKEVDIKEHEYKPTSVSGGALHLIQNSLGLGGGGAYGGSGPVDAPQTQTDEGESAQGATPVTTVTWPTGYEKIGEDVTTNLNSIFGFTRQPNVDIPSYLEQTRTTRQAILDEMQARRDNQGEPTGKDVEVTIDGVRYNLGNKGSQVPTNKELEGLLSKLNGEVENTLTKNQTEIAYLEARNYLEWEHARLKKDTGDVGLHSVLDNTFQTLLTNLEQKYDKLLTDPTSHSYKKFYEDYGGIPTRQNGRFWDKDSQKMIDFEGLDDSRTYWLDHITGSTIDSYPTRSKFADEYISDVAAFVEHLSQNNEMSEGTREELRKMKQTLENTPEDAQFRALVTLTAGHEVNIFDLYDRVMQILATEGNPGELGDTTLSSYPASELLESWAQRWAKSLKDKLNSNQVESHKKGGTIKLVPKAQSGLWLKDNPNDFLNLDEARRRRASRWEALSNPFPSKGPIIDNLFTPTQENNTTLSNPYLHKGPITDSLKDGLIAPTQDRVKNFATASLNSQQSKDPKETKDPTVDGLKAQVYGLFKKGYNEDVESLLKLIGDMDPDTADQLRDELYPKGNYRVEDNRSSVGIGPGVLGAGLDLALAYAAYRKPVANVPVPQKRHVDGAMPNVRAARGIDATARAKMEQEIANLSRNKYGGSDAMVNTLQAVLSNSQATASRANLAAAEGTYRRQESDRVFHDTNTREAAVRANMQNRALVEAENRQAKYQGDLNRAQAEAMRTSSLYQSLGSIKNNLMDMLNTQRAQNQNFHAQMLNQDYQMSVQEDYKKISSLQNQLYEVEETLARVGLSKDHKETAQAFKAELEAKMEAAQRRIAGLRSTLLEDKREIDLMGRINFSKMRDWFRGRKNKITAIN